VPTFGILAYSGSHKIGDLNAIKAYPNIWIQGDSLAKSTYSTVLTDLGQFSSKTNILTDARLSQYFTSNFSLALKHIANAKPGPATQDYDTLKAATGPLGIRPSVINTTYICQVPRLKSSGTLFIAVLVADLVLLQALWKIFTLATGWLLLAKNQGDNECEGCAALETDHKALSADSPDGNNETRASGYQPVELKSAESSKAVPFND
jgi:hypothetical protein